MSEFLMWVFLINVWKLQDKENMTKLAKRGGIDNTTRHCGFRYVLCQDCCFAQLKQLIN